MNMMISLIVDAVRDSWPPEDIRELSAELSALAWIPVEERLPETPGLYCVMRSTGRVNADHFRGEYWESDHIQEVVGTVTHWQPLPNAVADPSGGDRSQPTHGG